MGSRNTVLFRVCAGCDAPVDLQLLPWSGATFRCGQTLCTPCHERVAPAVDQVLDSLTPAPEMERQVA